MTEAEEQEIEAEKDKRFDERLLQVYNKIVEKAEFLVKMEVPHAYKVKDPL